MKKSFLCKHFLSIAFVLSLVFMAGYFAWVMCFMRSHPRLNEYHIERLKTPEKVYVLPMDVVTIADNSLDAKERQASIDSIWVYLNHIADTVDRNQNWIQHSQETLINDIRQETNNNIDKLSIISGIGLGLIGIFGCFIPMLQSKLNREELEEKIEKWMKLNEEKIGLEISRSRDSFGETINKIKEEQKRIERQTTLVQINNLAGCLTLGLNSKQMDNNENVRLFISSLWEEMCGKLTSLVAFIEKDINDKAKHLLDDRNLLLHALIQIDEVLLDIRLRQTNSYVIQETTLICDRIRVLCEQLYLQSFTFDKKFIESLNELMRDMRFYRLRFTSGWHVVE